MPNAEALQAVETKLRREVDAFGSLRAVALPGARGAPLFGTSRFFAVLAGDEFITFDIRSPGPAVSRLTSWHVSDLEAKRTSDLEVELSVPSPGAPRVRLKAADEDAERLLDMVVRRSGLGPPVRLVAAGVVMSVITFGGVLYRAVVIEGETLRAGTLLAIVVAVAMLSLFGLSLVARLRRRRRFFRS